MKFGRKYFFYLCDCCISWRRLVESAFFTTQYGKVLLFDIAVKRWFVKSIVCNSLKNWELHFSTSTRATIHFRNSISSFFPLVAHYRFIQWIKRKNGLTIISSSEEWRWYAFPRANSKNKMRKENSVRNDLYSYNTCIDINITSISYSIFIIKIIYSQTRIFRIRFSWIQQLCWKYSTSQHSWNKMENELNFPKHSCYTQRISKILYSPGHLSFTKQLL